MLGIIPLLIGFAIGAFKTYDLFNSIIMNKEEVYVGPLLLFSVFMIITGILILMFGFIAEMNTRMFYSGSSATNYSIEKIIE